MPKFQSPKVHLVSLRECPPGKSGKPYFKGRWGDATVLLFPEDRPYRVENGRAYYDWNLVVANDYSVIRAYREPEPQGGSDDPESGVSGGSTMKAARREPSSTKPARQRSRRMERSRVARKR